MSLHTKTLIITQGEPAGIGPDIICAFFATFHNLCASLCVLGDPTLFKTRAKQLGLEDQLSFRVTDRPLPFERGVVPLYPIETATQHEAGKPHFASGPHVLAQLDTALSFCHKKTNTALVTAPLDKHLIAHSLPSFKGHTDYLRIKTHTDSVTMMLACSALKVSLVTDHIPLRDVPAQLSAARVEETILHTHTALNEYYNIPKPKIAVLGLNPHAGEKGVLGEEERTILLPLITKLRKQGFSLSDPLPADSAFSSKYREYFDGYVAMYHDQGLIPIKTLHFEDAVNLTLNLPFIRTSVDHGTAYDLAGTGKANYRSFTEALLLAQRLLKD